jgi:flagellar basal body-associated protein FliL
MLKNKKIFVVILPVLLFVAYTMTKPKPHVAKPKIAGTIYVMPQTFLLNLSDGRYAKLSVALQLAPGQSDGATAATASSSEGAAGTLPEEPAIREIVTNAVTGQSGETLVSGKGRRDIQHAVLAEIRRQTDVKVEAVLFPDFTVQ